MTTTAKGWTLLDAGSPMSGPDQINLAAQHAEDLIDVEVAAASALPTTGNWPGRTITVTADPAARNNGVWVWGPNGWVLTVPFTTAAPIASFSTGWSGLTGGHAPRLRRQGNHVSLYGGIVFGSGPPSANYNSMFTVPAAFAPATTSSQFIGTAIVSVGSGNGQAVALLLTNGLVSTAGAGYSTGSLPGNGAITTLGGCSWWMD